MGSVLRNRQVNIQRGLLGLKKQPNRLGRRGGVGIRDLKGQPVRIQSGSAREGKIALRQGLLIDLQIEEAPRPEIQPSQAKLQTTLDIAVARLQVLRREEGAFRPDDRLKLAHGLRLTLAGAVRESQKRFHAKSGCERRPTCFCTARFSERSPNTHFFRAKWNPSTFDSQSPSSVVASSAPIYPEFTSSALFYPSELR